MQQFKREDQQEWADPFCLYGIKNYNGANDRQLNYTSHIITGQLKNVDQGAVKRRRNEQECRTAHKPHVECRLVFVVHRQAVQYGKKDQCREDKGEHCHCLGFARCVQHPIVGIIIGQVYGQHHQRSQHITEAPDTAVKIRSSCTHEDGLHQQHEHPAHHDHPVKMHDPVKIYGTESSGK